MSVLINGATFRHQLESFLLNILSKKEKNKRKRTFNGMPSMGTERERTTMCCYTALSSELSERKG